MPPEKKSETESAQLKKTVDKLEAKVDRLEPQEQNETATDWSESVRQAVEEGEKEIREEVQKLSPYLSDPEELLSKKLKAYRLEIDRITRELPLRNDEFNIGALRRELYLLDEDPKSFLQEESEAAARKKLGEDPYGFVFNFEKYAKLKNSGSLLQEAVHACIENGDADILPLQYSLLKDRTFFEAECRYALEKLQREGTLPQIFTWVTALAQCDHSYIRRPEVQKVLPLAFKASLLDSSSSFNVEAYMLYEAEVWFESALKISFEELCSMDPLNALKLLKKLETKAEFLDQVYVKDKLPQLVPEAMNEDPVTTLSNYELYREIYTPDEWKDLLVNKVIASFDKRSIGHVLENLKTVKRSLPTEALALLLARGTYLAPGSLMWAWPNYSDQPDAKEYFAEAARNLYVLEPGEALRLLYQDDRGVLPFDNRDSYLHDVALLAIERNPSSAVTYSAAYEHLPDAEALLARAQKRSLIAQALARKPYPDATQAEMLLMRDPALETVDWIERSWLPSSLSDVEFAETAALISRNLYLSQPRQLPNERNVPAEYLRILETRENYENFPLFQDRNILLGSHIETWSTGKDRFGKQALVDELKKQQGTGRVFEHHEAKDPSVESLKKAKEAILLGLETIPSPLTFLFDGHGSPDALYLSDGEVPGLQATEPKEVLETQNTVKITVDEFSASLVKRSKKFGKEKISKDILIFSACYNQTFLRSMYERLDGAGAGKPIALGESEFGQVSWSGQEGVYGSILMDRLIDPTKPTTLGDIWKLPYIYENNPSLFIPSKNTVQQVAMNSDQDVNGLAA